MGVIAATPSSKLQSEADRQSRFLESSEGTTLDIKHQGGYYVHFGPERMDAVGDHKLFRNAYGYLRHMGSGCGEFLPVARPWSRMIESAAEVDFLLAGVPESEQAEYWLPLSIVARRTPHGQAVQTGAPRDREAGKCDREALTRDVRSDYGDASVI